MQAIDEVAARLQIGAGGERGAEGGTRDGRAVDRDGRPGGRGGDLQRPGLFGGVRALRRQRRLRGEERDVGRDAGVLDAREPLRRPVGRGGPRRGRRVARGGVVERGEVGLREVEDLPGDDIDGHGADEEQARREPAPHLEGVPPLADPERPDPPEAAPLDGLARRLDARQIEGALESGLGILEQERGQLDAALARVDLTTVPILLDAATRAAALQRKPDESTVLPSETIKKWLSEAAGSRAREEYKTFAEIYEQFVLLWRNRVELNVLRVADDVSNRSCLPASLKVLEWLAEDESLLGERDDSIGPVPADLASYLTDEEIELLERREAAKQAEEDEDARLLTLLRARKAQEQVERATE